MASYRLWGQVQRITATQYLLLASASPLAAGKPASIVRTAVSEDEAQKQLGNILAELDEQLHNRGDDVVFSRH